MLLIPKLSKKNNYWLNNLRNDLKAGGEIRSIIEKYEKYKNSKLYQALADTIMRANWEEVEAERNMCEALRELFADDLENLEMKERWRERLSRRLRRLSRSIGRAAVLNRQLTCWKNPLH